MSFITQEASSVQKALEIHGIETPLHINYNNPNKRKKLIEKYLIKIIQLLNLDIKHESLSKTPKRVATMFVDEIFSGLNYNNFPKINLIKNNTNFNDMIIVRNIPFISFCEHHFITIDGTSTIAYIPNDNIIGLSKINRIVHFFSQRPQIQERLTQQILIALQTILFTKHVAVSITATHYCMKAREIHTGDSVVVTTLFGGLFKSENHTQKKFLRIIS
uniref:GTP cyclohydrolase 1 n=1 Tax=Candidatus Aschnera chinzeii TaxID=1485666 RepID=A0AAT9G3P1_9ENTR|nr:MAG: GTP cyclohydrolase I FolE [Candidatus Aschnera chinzeii]